VASRRKTAESAVGSRGGAPSSAEFGGLAATARFKKRNRQGPHHSQSTPRYQERFAAARFCGNKMSRGHRGGARR
jgi:hypothetical protein